MNRMNKIGVETYRSYQKKISYVRLLFKTIYRRKDPYWKAEYLRKKEIFHHIGGGVILPVH